MSDNLLAGKIIECRLLLGCSTQTHDLFVRLRERSRQ
jgi:hypothetical protein